MEKINSKEAESEYGSVKNQYQRNALIEKLIASLKNYEQNPDEAAKVVIDGKNAEIFDLQSKLDEAISGKEEAEKMAKEAIEFANSNEDNTTNDTFVTVEGNKYKIVFTVDGLTKDQMKDDSALCARLVNIDSAALELQEGK